MDLENRLQKTLTKEIAVISLMALTSLNGCMSYLHHCPAYTSNSKEKEIAKMDASEIVINYNDKNYPLNN